LKKEDLLHASVIVIAGIAAYSNSFSCSLHFDDFPNIVSNPAITNLHDWRAWMLFNPSRPVAFFTFALNYHFNALDVPGYHLVNLLIHLLNALLVWRIVLLIFRSQHLKDHPLAGFSRQIAFFTALLFVLHPLMTESVTYIVQRLVSLASLFCLLSILFFIKGILSDRPVSRYLYFLSSAIAAVLGFFTKETSYSLPFLIILVYCFFYFRRMTLKRRSVMFLILLLFAVLSFLSFKALQSGKYFSPIPPREGHPYIITPLKYYYTQVNVLITYLRLIVLPINQTLDYNYPMAESIWGLRILVKLAILLAIIATAVRQFNRDRLLSFGIFWFFIAIAPQCLVPRSNFIFEHRTYLASIGIILVWVLLFYYIFGRIRLLKLKGNTPAPLFITLAASLLFVQGIIFGWMTWERNKIWKDEYSLWSDCLLKAPGSARALVNLGCEQVYRQEYPQALKNFDQAILIFPLYFQAWNSRAAARINIGENEKAVEELNFVIIQNPAFLDAYINRGIAFRNIKLFDAAISDFTAALSISPNRSDTYFQRGLSFWMAGRNEAALTDVTQAATMNNQDAIVFLQRNLR